LLKKLKAWATGEFDDDSVGAQISKLIQADEQTATLSTIKGFFGKAKLEHDVTKLDGRNLGVYETYGFNQQNH
jgi:hypothetical protein